LESKLTKFLIYIWLVLIYLYLVFGEPVGNKSGCLYVNNRVVK